MAKTRSITKREGKGANVTKTVPTRKGVLPKQSVNGATQAPGPVATKAVTAEGLKALGEVIGKLDGADNATIVVAHHLDAEQRRKLGILLSSDPHVQTAEAIQRMEGESAARDESLKRRVAELGIITDEIANILESIHLPLLIVGKDMRVRRCSPAADRVLHTGMLDVGRHITSIQLSTTVPDIATMISEVIAAGKIAQREVVDASGHWFSLVVRPYITGEGKIEGAVLTFVDIDDQKRNSAASEARRVLAERFLDVTHGILLVLDAQLNVTMIGKSGRELLGWSEGEIVGRDWTDRFVSEHYRTAVLAIFDRIRGEGLDDTYEYPVVAKDGEERTISWRTAVVRDETGKVTALVCSGEDLTMLRRINGALQKSEERLHVMMESVREDEFFIMDSEGYIVSWIARREGGKSFKAEEMIGEHFSRLYSSDDFQSGKPMRILDKAGSEGRFEEEGWRMRKDGSKMKANVLITAIRDEHRNLIGFSNVTRYIRDHVETKESASIQAPSGFVSAS